MIRTHGDTKVGSDQVDLDCHMSDGAVFRSGGKIKVGRNVYGIRRVNRRQGGVLPGRPATRIFLSCPLVFDVPHGTEVSAS